MDDGAHAQSSAGQDASPPPPLPSPALDCMSLTRVQNAVGDGAGAVERVGDASDAANVKQLVVKAGFTPTQADDALRVAGPSVQVIAAFSPFSFLVSHLTPPPPPPPPHCRSRACRFCASHFQVPPTTLRIM